MYLVVYDLSGNTKDTSLRASLTETHFLTISDGKFSPSCPAIESFCKVFSHYFFPAQVNDPFPVTIIREFSKSISTPPVDVGITPGSTSDTLMQSPIPMA